MCGVAGRCTASSGTACIGSDARPPRSSCDSSECVHSSALSLATSGGASPVSTSSDRQNEKGAGREVHNSTVHAAAHSRRRATTQLGRTKHRERVERVHKKTKRAANTPRQPESLPATITRFHLPFAYPHGGGYVEKRGGGASSARSSTRTAPQELGESPK